VSKQLALRFDEVGVNCPVQQRYHAIAPCLAGKSSPAETARSLDISYSTVTRWLRQFRAEGMPGLFPATEYPREPYTPERVIVTVLYYKCCAPRASDRELARAVGNATGHRLHNETVKALLSRYFFWRYTEFRRTVQYPIPADPVARRMEIIKLYTRGWTERSIAVLLHCHENTVRKWLRRARHPVGAQLEPLLADLPRAPHHTHRKVQMGVIHATLELQKKYGYAGWFRIQGYLERDHGIRLGQTTLKKIMRLNRKLHLAPSRPVRVFVDSDIREAPPVSRQPFDHTYIDIRYLDAKPEGTQLYSCLLLEGYSRTILAGSLTRRQDLGVVLRVYYLALLHWGCWSQVISDHGKQFDSGAFSRINRRLQIAHTMYPKGHPWRNLIESQFGIQARLGEYGWARCTRIDDAVEFHRELIRDHNRLPHFAHRKRDDRRHAPLEVLGGARGREVEPATLHRAFSRMNWQRKTDARGFVRLGRWKIYVEEGLPHTPVQVIYWEGRLRAEYHEHALAEYRCRWDESGHRPEAMGQLRHYESPYISKQDALFDPLWMRDPIEAEPSAARPRQRAAGGRQLRLYLGPEAVR